jgi:branched-chain amino acid transport system ATP-binding protein
MSDEDPAEALRDGRGNKDRSITKDSRPLTAPPDGLSQATGAARAGGPVLIGEAMTGGYGRGADILHDCTIAVEHGQIAVIVGPNGAGKSTAMKAVFGMLPLRHGQVRLDGADITALSPQARVAHGMAFVPQNHNIFTTLTVEENLEMGAFLREDDISATMAQVFDLFPILRDKRRQPAGELSGGQRQQVAVGRALMTGPSVLMLDEPTAGVSPIVMDELFDRIIEVARTGISILMVEQNARQALEIADRGYVLVQGGNAYTGTGAELLADPEVRRSFLGG